VSDRKEYFGAFEKFLSETSMAQIVGGAVELQAHPWYSGSPRLHGEDEAKNIVSLRTGWKYIMKHGIQPLQASLEQSFPDAIQRFMATSANSEENDEVALYLHNSMQKNANLINRYHQHQDSTRLYTLVYRMAIQQPPNNHCASLYKLVAGLLSAYVEKHVYEKLVLLLHQGNQNNPESDEKLVMESKNVVDEMVPQKTSKLFLPTFVVRWDLFRKFNSAVGMYFKYLNRYYVTHNELQDTESLGLHLFQSVVEMSLRDRIAEEVTELLVKVRSRPDSEAHIMKLMTRTVQVFVELGVYSEFEQLLLNKFSASYRDLGKNLLQQQLTIFGLVEKANAIQSREIELIRSLLPVSSHKTFSSAFHNEFLGKDLPAFISHKSKLWTQFFSSAENTHRRYFSFDHFWMINILRC
jgi:hypothetical protein